MTVIAVLLLGSVFVYPWAGARIYLASARSAAVKGDRERVLLYADRALALRPDYARAYDLKGDALQDLRKHEESEVAYKKAIELGTNRLSTYIFLAENLSTFGRKDEATAVLTNALTLRWVIGSDQNQARVFAALGKVAQSAKEYAQAEGYFRSALQFDSKNSGYLNGLGVTLFLQGKNDEALTAFNDALKATPTALTYANIANVYFKQGRINDAITTAEKGRQLDDKEPFVYEILGYVYREAGRTSEARAAFTKYLELVPNWIADGNFQNVVEIRAFLEGS